MDELPWPVAPCIGSGYCCKKSLCWVGLRVHGTMPGPCPSLVFDGERHWCGEVLKAEGSQKEELKHDLHIGAGCCSSLNSDRREMLVKLRLRSNSSSPSSER